MRGDAWRHRLLDTKNLLYCRARQHATHKHFNCLIKQAYWIIIIQHLRCVFLFADVCLYVSVTTTASIQLHTPPAATDDDD